MLQQVYLKPNYLEEKVYLLRPVSTISIKSCLKIIRQNFWQVWLPQNIHYQKSALQSQQRISQALTSTAEENLDRSVLLKSNIFRKGTFRNTHLSQPVFTQQLKVTFILVHISYNISSEIKLDLFPYLKSSSRGQKQRYKTNAMTNNACLVRVYPISTY